MTKERFEQTAFKMTYQEYNACDCTKCCKENCPHRDSFRRFPFVDGGLALCPNLRGLGGKK